LTETRFIIIGLGLDCNCFILSPDNFSCCKCLLELIYKKPCYSACALKYMKSFVSVGYSKMIKFNFYNRCARVGVNYMWM